MSKIKIVVYVPESHSEAVRMAMGDAGAGVIGNYSHCAFTTKGEGSYLPLPGAHPTIGEVGTMKRTNEMRIEMTCEKEKYDDVISQMKKVHPYEEPAYEL